MMRNWPSENIEFINPSKIAPSPRNPRTHSDKQVQQIASAIKEWGFTMPILVDEGGVIIAGHGRHAAALKLNLDEVPVMLAKDWSESKKRAYVIADNKIALNSEWDDELLSIEMMDLKDSGFDLELTGFDDFNFEELEEEIQDYEEPEVPEVKEPVTKLGDVWVLGEHRLMCGDATIISDVEKLLDGAKIDLIHTDPPYGINEKCDRDFSSRTRKAKGGKFEDIIGDDSIETAIDSFNLCKSLGIEKQVWWGANYYAHSVPQTNNWIVWDKRVEEHQKDMNSDCELAWVQSKWSSVRIFRHLWKGMIKGSENGQKRVHPTQKPIDLALWVFDYFGDVSNVLDLFGGSGFNLLAAEKKNKKAFIMEMSAAYCDVMIGRWQEMTGKKAILESTGELYDNLKKD